jgi:hypothetical protein
VDPVFLLLGLNKPAPVKLGGLQLAATSGSRAAPVAETSCSRPSLAPTRSPPAPREQVGDSKPGFFAIASPPDPNNQGGRSTGGPGRGGSLAAQALDPMSAAAALANAPALACARPATEAPPRNKKASSSF